MMERAEVSSVQAIAEFRTALLVYIEKVRPLLDDATDEVFRMREWLRVTQRLHWENQVRLRTRLLTNAEQALFSAELAKLRAPSSAEVQAVHKAKRELAAAEEKLKITKRVSSLFEKETLPRVKQIDELRSYTGTEVVDAVRFLEGIVESLDRYLAIPNPTPPP